MALYRGKKNKCWIWKVLDSLTGELLEWECGDRSAKTLKRLLDRIQHWHVDYYCADEWEAYRKLLPADKLVQSKALTVAIERNNGRQRHWLARFRRKTICLSRSVEMVDLSIFLFAAYHVNKTIQLPSLFT